MVKVYKFNEHARLPTRAHSTDAGLDLYCNDVVTVNPGEKKLIGTGIGIALNDGQVGLIWDKSGLAAKYGLTILGGVIDSGYRGEVKVIVLNTSKVFYKFDTHEKIAQLVIHACDTSPVEVVDVVNDNTQRGTSGLGSSGK